MPLNSIDPLGLHCPVGVNPPPVGCGSNDPWGGGDNWTYADWFASNGFGGGGGFGVGFSGGMPCSDFMPCGLPVPSLVQSIWSDLLGLPSGLNCPQVGGLSDYICGGANPVADLTNNGMPGCTDMNSSAIDKGIQSFSLLRIGEHWKEWALAPGKYVFFKWAAKYLSPKELLFVEAASGVGTLVMLGSTLLDATCFMPIGKSNAPDIPPSQLPFPQ
jgi:hypothetical protein